MINIGDNISELYVGSTGISEAYVGSQLVYTAEVLPADSYIQDGLIFQLDGIEKGAESGWVDLVDNKVFTGGATSMDKCFSFNSSYLSNDTYLPANEDYTVEALFVQTTNNASGGVLFCSADGSTVNYVCLAKTGSKLLFLERKNTYTVSSSNNVPIYISANLTRALYNGEVISPNSTTDYWSGFKKTVLGSSNVGTTRYRFMGRIYTIRIYSRRLSEEEQRFNYNIDKKRFKL